MRRLRGGGGEDFGFQPGDGAGFEVGVGAVLQGGLDEGEARGGGGVRVQDVRGGDVGVVAQRRGGAGGGYEGEGVEVGGELFVVFGVADTGVVDCAEAEEEDGVEEPFCGGAGGAGV